MREYSFGLAYAAFEEKAYEKTKNFKYEELTVKEFMKTLEVELSRICTFIKLKQKKLHIHFCFKFFFGYAIVVFVLHLSI